MSINNDDENKFVVQGSSEVERRPHHDAERELGPRERKCWSTNGNEVAKSAQKLFWAQQTLILRAFPRFSGRQTRHKHYVYVRLLSQGAFDDRKS